MVKKQNRKRLKIRRRLVSVLAAALMMQNILTAVAASATSSATTGEVNEVDISVNFATSSNTSTDQVTSLNANDPDADSDLEDDLATDSNAKIDIFEDMPEIGTTEFTKWFFEHVSFAELWDWFVAEMANADQDDVFLAWYYENEDRVMEALQQYTSGLSVMMLRSSSVGDLWDNWNGNTVWNGDGTASSPYQISVLSDLMGLSEMVAAGYDFEGTYFELTQDIDLGNININSGSWNPIGWYQQKTELSGAVSHKFKGNFDGANNTIVGLKVSNSVYTLNNVGLFGALEGGTIKNLTVEADTISGGDNVGILAGSISSDTIIYNVTVSGYISAQGDAGGIAGEVVGKKMAKSGTATIENCFADGVTINSQQSNYYVGGIAGNVQYANIVDNKVLTYDGDANRIQGKGYVGGVVGRMNKTNVWNSYVNGTIGGNGSTAIGGIVGKYESGDLILARFAGTISKSNNGTASREGTFVGTRESMNNFTYGTNASNNISYLFTDSVSKAKKVFGSNIENDNIFSASAHIGYWTDNERNVTLVAGSTETKVEGRFFYEELEAAVKFVTVSKLQNSFTAEDYSNDCDFALDHFVPNSYGAPIRGYLVSIPRIDARNANGTYDTDVASLTALGVTTNSYYRTIDKDSPSAVAPGDIINITTAAKNNYGSRYQMVYDSSEAGKVKPPTYTDEEGSTVKTTYIAGGTYTFYMPECDTEINAEYIKVTTALTMTPEITTLKVVQTRDGDRKNPTITTVVYNNEGTQIAKYIGDIAQVTPNPIHIHAEHNGEGSAADKTVMWSVDNTDLVTLTNGGSYTLADAYVMPSLSSSFISNIINTKVKQQSDNAYLEAIDNTIYSDVAVITATTNPATSVNNIAVVGNTRVNVTFQIVDNTTRRVEGLNLNMSNMVYTVTRTLTGDRSNLVETYTCSEPSVLSATLNPQQPFFKNVAWTEPDNGNTITLTPGGNNTEECTVNVRFDNKGIENPAWIQNIINADNQKHKEDKYARLSGTGEYTTTVTATSEDQTHGVVTASCNVKIIFVTVDETVIHPESVTMNPDTVHFNLAITKKGSATGATNAKTGFDTKKLRATINPSLADNDTYKTYNRGVTWSVSESDVLTISQDGTITPLEDAQWIKDAMKQSPYEAIKTVLVYATTKDNGIAGMVTVTLSFKGTIEKTSSSGGSGGGGGSTSGTKSVGTTTSAGGGPAGSVVGTWTQLEDERWMFATTERTYVNEWVYIYNPYAAEGQTSVSWFRFDEQGYMVTGWFTDIDGHMYYLNPAFDLTQGRMLTNWQYIDGFWYCFSEETTQGNPVGSLLRNITTSEERVVNDQGQWVQ